MNIHENGELDIPGAIAELKSVGARSGDAARRQAVAEIQTAALLDIALSLRVLATEAAAAMPVPSEPEIAAVEASADDFFVEGDLVMMEGSTEPGEIIGFGESEGAMYAEVTFADGVVSRVWLDKLTRLRGDEGADAAESTIETLRALNAEADGEPDLPEPEDLVDEIDDDFDGDNHTAAASALDVLKANEAARKAAKKKGSKK